MIFAKLCELGLNNTLALVISVFFTAVLSYLLGSINFSVILSRKLFSEDVREKGSGNGGSTNMLRNYGIKAGLLTFGGDAVKTALAVLLGLLFFLERGMFIAGIFCMLGHIFPLFFNFKGGKGVVCFTVIVLMTSIKTGQWYIFVILFVIFAISVLGTKIVSLSSIICAMLYPVILNRIDEYLISNVPDLSFLSGLEVYAVVLSVIVIIKHKDNIIRLLNGEEKKISLKKKKEND